MYKNLEEKIADKTDTKEIDEIIEKYVKEHFVNIDEVMPYSDTMPNINHSLVSTTIIEEDITIDEIIEDIKITPKAIDLNNIDKDLEKQIEIALFGKKSNLSS
ncbi:MAG: hypothetical protein QM493_10150 [Sulfurovum sp.]